MNRKNLRQLDSDGWVLLSNEAKEYVSRLENACGYAVDQAPEGPQAIAATLANIRAKCAKALGLKHG